MSQESILRDTHDCQEMQDSCETISRDFHPVQQKSNEYPDLFENVQGHLDFPSSSLQLSLSNYKDEKKKNRDFNKASFGQAIIQTARSKSIECPLQLGLDIQVHKMFASKNVIDFLNKLGISIDYPHITRYESNTGKLVRAE